MSDVSGTKLTIAYSSALAVVALMSLASHVTLGRILAEQQGSASVINVAGRQRMLSQRIAGLLAERELGAGLDRELAEAIDKFEASHRALLMGDPGQRLSPVAAPALRAIYFGGAMPLDAAVRDFIAKARRVAGAPADDPAARREAAQLFAEAREPILTRLDEVVSVDQAISDAQLHSLGEMQTVSVFVVLATLILEALLIFRPMVRRIARTTQALLRMATTDPLTGTLNRRSFTDRAGAELSRARRHGRPVSLLMIDADRFKGINDSFGHAGGDAVLRAFAAACMDCLRPSDVLGRLGGEEFGVVLAETGIAGAAAAAERIRGAVEGLEVDSDGRRIRVTVSIGVSGIDDGAHALKDAMDRADAALYRAKALGRNRVAVAPAPTAPDAPGDAAAYAAV